MSRSGAVASEFFFRITGYSAVAINVPVFLN